MAKRRISEALKEGTVSVVKRGAFVSLPLRSYDQPWYLHEKIFALPLPLDS